MTDLLVIPSIIGRLDRFMGRTPDFRDPDLLPRVGEVIMIFSWFSKDVRLCVSA